MTDLLSPCSKWVFAQHGEQIAIKVRLWESVCGGKLARVGLAKLTRILTSVNSSVSGVLDPPLSCSSTYSTSDDNKVWGEPKGTRL